MIRECDEKDFESILGIINDAAMKYKGVIPAECWREPYMSEEALKKDIESGVQFYGYEEVNVLIGVMGIQYFPDVTLIRDAYVRGSAQGKGIGGTLLRYLISKTDKPVLIGTWRDTEWSVKFYEKHGFKVLGKSEADALLKKYWVASKTHFDNSVVLADGKYAQNADL
jgi:N-acetylglutamate synthase-like GNAT family acetyltransferase